MNKPIFKMRTDRPDAKGQFQIFVIYYCGEKTPYKQYTGFRAKTEQWDKDRQQFRRNYPNFAQHNIQLQQIAAKLMNIVANAAIQNIPISKQYLKQSLKQAQQDNQQTQSIPTLSQLFKDFLTAPQTLQKAPNTQRNYAIAIRHLKTFLNLKRIDPTPEQYTIQLHDQFVNFCIHYRNHSPNTLFGTIKSLKTLFKYISQHQQLNVKTEILNLKAKYIDQPKIFLTEQELQQIAQVKTIPKLNKYRDCFLFQCYTGLRYSDISRLTTDNLTTIANQPAITIIQQKTKKPITLALPTLCIQIIRKYNKTDRKKLIPIPSNQHYNRAVKIIARMAGITTPTPIIQYKNGQPVQITVPKYRLLTTHIARHTFATISLMRGMDIKTLQELLGHAKIQHTLTYAKLLDAHKINQHLKFWND